jgi:hypothetical protein
MPNTMNTTLDVFNILPRGEQQTLRSFGIMFRPSYQVSETDIKAMVEAAIEEKFAQTTVQNPVQIPPLPNPYSIVEP